MHVTVLDGGMSNALEALGADLRDDLWTARLLRDDPAAIAAVHTAYFRAGAQVATTASYQASVSGFVSAGIEAGDAERLIASSVALARVARDEVGTPGLLVAASVGPYGAVLADGAEYRPVEVSASALRDFHAPRLELLAAAGPDVLAVETIADVREAEVLVELLDDVGLPAWFSYTVDGARTRAGQPLADAYAALAGSSAVTAAGVNCSAPEDVLDAVRAAVDQARVPAIVYPNRGETWDGAARRWCEADGRWRAFELVPDWIEAGARIVGGCCRVGPGEIAELAATLAG